MRKNLFGFLIPAFFLLASRGWAAPPCPASPASQPVYVSSRSQILCIETAPTPAATGQVAILVTDNSSVFGDIAFGPDGWLYFTDTLGNRVFRFDPSSSAASATLVANIPSGTAAGLSFSGSDGDLYVNSSTGVWKIGRIASLFAPLVSTPVTLTTADRVITFASSISAGGNAFDGPGNLDIVDQTNSQVLQSAPPYTVVTATPVTGISNTGPGAAINFCGDILVASGTRIQRFSGGALSTLADFGKGNVVRYFEVTAGNTVFAATFANGAGGIVWRVDPAVPSGSGGVPSCTAMNSPTQVVSLKGALQAKTPPDLASSFANGVALPPTSLSITATFTPSRPKQLFNFGQHTLSVSYLQVLTSFSQTFTAVRARPADITFSSTAFPNSTVAVHYSSLGGFAVQYVTPTTGAPQVNFQYGPSTSTQGAITLLTGFFTQDFLLQPGLAHAPGDNLTPTPVTYVDDITHDLWEAGAPGLDPGVGASTNNWSKYLAFNEGLNVQGAIFTLKQPVASCSSGTGCNPQFNSGQSIRVAFTLTTSSGVSIPNAIARLSIARIDASGNIIQTIQVVSKNNQNFDNFFSSGTSGSLYTYTADSTGFPAGTYQFTIFSDSFSPQTFLVKVQ